ncbi:MAG: hypothetical protein U0R27_00315 [Candidatus Nanopelagicales bacterium]
MKRFMSLLAVLAAALMLAACSSGSTPRTDPFPGQWESTGGEQIAMRVDAPTDGAYPVTITGDNLEVALSAKQTGDNAYEGKTKGATTYTFSMVDDELLTATVAPKGGTSATTSFKRVGD